MVGGKAYQIDSKGVLPEMRWKIATEVYDWVWTLHDKLEGSDHT